MKLTLLADVRRNGGLERLAVTVLQRCDGGLVLVLKVRGAETAIGHAHERPELKPYALDECQQRIRAGALVDCKWKR